MYSRLLPGLSAFVCTATPAWRMVGVCRFAFSSGKKTTPAKGGKVRTVTNAQTDIAGVKLPNAGSKRTQVTSESTTRRAAENVNMDAQTKMSDLEQLKAKILLLESPPLEPETEQSETPQPLEESSNETAHIPEEDNRGVKEGSVNLSSDNGEEYELPPMSQQFKPGEVGTLS